MDYKQKKIVTKLNKVEKVELGITQDIQLDINSITESVKSVRRVMIDAEIVLAKNAKAIQIAKKAIDRVKNTAIEIGAEEVLRIVQKQETEVKELEKNISKSIQGIGNAMQHIV